MLKELIPPEAGPDDPLWTTTIMTYELGSVVRALVRRRVKLTYGDDKGARAYEAEAKIELADLLTQVYVLAEQMGWKRIDLENDGKERFEERMREIEEGVL